MLKFFNCSKRLTKFFGGYAPGLLLTQESIRYEGSRGRGYYHNTFPTILRVISKERVVMVESIVILIVTPLAPIEFSSAAQEFMIWMSVWKCIFFYCCESLMFI